MRKAQNIKKISFSSEAEETRRRLGWQMFHQLLSTNTDFFGDNARKFVYDCAIKLYATTHLAMKVNEIREFELILDRVFLHF